MEQTDPELSGIKIMRMWYTMTHNHRQIAKIDSAYTVRCMGSHAENLFLVLDDFLPNLKVVDSTGEEYPVMTKEDIDRMLALKRANNPKLDKVARKIEQGSAVLLWIRFPPNRVMKREETRMIHLLYERREENVLPWHVRLKQTIRVLWTLKKPDTGCIKLRITPRSFRVFWTFKKPDDYKLADKMCAFNTPDKTIKKPWDKMLDVAHHDRTPDSETLMIRSSLDAVISYRLKPKTSVVLFPRITFGLLLALSSSLLFLRFVGWDGLDELLERDVELALFAASSSVVASRLIRNVEIRHGHMVWFLASIGLLPRCSCKQ